MAPTELVNESTSTRVFCEGAPHGIYLPSTISCSLPNAINTNPCMSSLWAGTDIVSDAYRKKYLCHTRDTTSYLQKSKLLVRQGLLNRFGFHRHPQGKPSCPFIYFHWVPKSRISMSMVRTVTIIHCSGYLSTTNMISSSCRVRNNG